jgi:hypothetical protein
VQSVLASLKFRSILSSLHTFRQGGASILAPLGSRCELFLFRCDPSIKDAVPSAVTREGADPHFEKWPPVTAPTPKEERMVYPGAGSELFHGKKKV